MGSEVLQRHLANIARLAPLIETHADDAERQRRLPQPIVQALTDAGLFKLYLPQSLGGSELEPLEFAQCLEAISRIDGSTGWCAFIGNVNTDGASVGRNDFCGATQGCDRFGVLSFRARSAQGRRA